ncbi:GntR family transcriptional regulator [Pseudonocardia alaniniphila]|uniref:GntR family transcriptional regulator n=1 Tax=Pseudonocardia alaniniphila TaxID=75291 RepID=A0ABS9TKZ8_9PSEU|nr:GntR family transcriptional regulator [Pseudonocardia alaniniphila]MCH6169212.1 GntR family transcriptional regulator [Pseudonocardia alaniniphila]
MAAAESAAGRVTRDLRRRVLSGDLKPGTVLSQARIAAEYDVSRMPARDALQVLANEGLVDLGPATSVVRELSIAELQELYELREAVEPLLTRLAVPNVGRAQMAQMAALVDVMESEVSPAEWLEANARFHAHIFTCADRPRMIELTQHLRRLTDRYLYLHIGVIENLEHLHAEHREILDAVRAGDAAAAAEFTRLHLVTSHELILRHLLENELLAPLSQGG